MESPEERAPIQVEREKISVNTKHQEIHLPVLNKRNDEDSAKCRINAREKVVPNKIKANLREILHKLFFFFKHPMSTHKNLLFSARTARNYG